MAGSRKKQPAVKNPVGWDPIKRQLVEGDPIASALSARAAEAETQQKKYETAIKAKDASECIHD